LPWVVRKRRRLHHPRLRLNKKLRNQLLRRLLRVRRKKLKPLLRLRLQLLKKNSYLSLLDIRQRDSLSNLFKLSLFFFSVTLPLKEKSGLIPMNQVIVIPGCGCVRQEGHKVENDVTQVDIFEH
jgi:hypothetical protein